MNWVSKDLKKSLESRVYQIQIRPVDECIKSCEANTCLNFSKEWLFFIFRAIGGE